ncbi:MAG: glycosyl hydrolase family 3 [Eubacterium sp.]|nr:glycosyl hydrolase family 3 [Eubacterium sp.]
MKFLKKNQIYIILILLLGLCLAGTGCGRKKKEKGSQPEEASTMAKDSTEIDEIMMENLVDDLLEEMTLEEKIGQLFIVCTDSLDFDAETSLTDQAAERIEKYQPGGVIFFSFNLKNRDQTMKMIRSMQAHSRIPMFMAVDEEGGMVARVANTEGMGTTSFPPMAQIGAAGDVEKAAEVGETIGREIGALGFNLDFAPVADLTTNEKNTEIGERSFGSDPKLVSQMVSEEVKALQDQGVCATLKHFPGQGDTGEDTHRGYVNLETTIDRLRDVEFLPFKAGIRAGADMVMVSHVAVSNVTGNEVPASLSSLMVNDILREELRFDHVIVTDAMNMKVITKFYDSGQAARMALEAGNDMILMPDDFIEAYESIQEGVSEGEISEKTIDEAVRHILEVKLRRGIIVQGDE